MVVQVVDFSTAVRKNPLNPLGLQLRRLIWTALDQAAKDERITSIVLTGGGSGNFSAGADLTEFGQLLNAGATAGTAGTSSSGAGFFPLVELIHKIENFPKPIVAAVAGSALGGGLEVALSCHYRVTDASGKFGLPEVHVGVIPGAGGTQRLPRLVGVAKALDMILTGKTIDSSLALALGLVDQVESSSTKQSLLECAKKWAEWAELMPLADRRVGQKKIKETPQEMDMIFHIASQKIPSPEMGGEGVHAALNAVKACNLPIEEGLEVETNYFFETLAGDQGNARRHAFFAVRKAQKSIARPPESHPLLSKSLSSETAAVVGAGLMGSGIALVLLQAGFRVYLVDISKPSLDKGMAFLQGTIESYVQRGKLTPVKAAEMLKSLKATQSLEDLSPCRLVVEAVIENLVIKKKIFSSLDRILSPDAILLSNTSTLDIDAMASAVSPSRRQRFAGWHFFSPAHVMQLVEIVVGKDTSVETTSLLQYLTKRIKKTGVVCGNCDGFIGNRLLIPYGAETTFFLSEGVATVTSVDKAFVKFGIVMGPFQMGDLAGLDIGYNIRKERGWVRDGNTPAKNRPERYTELGDDLVSELKRLGQKSGKVRSH
jgi:3-hydroxyacyl-CoA dehydrogenase